MDTHTYKLSYFNVNGRGEATRMAFFIGGVEYEDDRFTFSEFGQRKKEFPLGQVPVLTIDGTIQLTQQMAILEYVGGLADLVPTDRLMRAYNNEILNLIEDITYKVSATMSISESEIRDAEREKLNNHFIPKYAKALDAILARHSKKFAVRDKLATSDIQIFLLVDRLESGILTGISKDILKPYTEIYRIRKAVATHEKVAAYLAKQAK